MRITIVVPWFSYRPIGGYKVQYEYAAGLVERGHDVTIVHATSPADHLGARILVHYGLTLARHGVRGHEILTWFTLDPRVKLRFIPILAGWMLPKADVTILTAWQTAAATNNPPRRSGRFVQVVYDYELWMSGNSDIRAQMQSALSRPDVALLATSRAVEEMLEEMGLNSAGIATAGIDLDLFQCVSPPSQREQIVGFAVRSEESKAISVVVEACEIIRKHRTDVSFVGFGHGNNTVLPDFVKHLGPLAPHALRDFYNSCMGFVLPSDYEGWGLPAAEAMACGACLITTANGGVEDFATDQVNCLIVSRRDPMAMAAAIERVIDDRALRLRLIENSLQKAQELGTGVAADRLDRILRELLTT